MWPGREAAHKGRVRAEGQGPAAVSQELDACEGVEGRGVSLLQQALLGVTSG